MNSKNKIRIGRISYTNVWPIFHHFKEEDVQAEIEWVEKVPAELNAAMGRGEIDICAMSSFAYGTLHDRIQLLPDLSVSANGSVRSVLLFHKKPLDAIKNGTIALSTASATSVHLLKIILQTFHGGHPEYVHHVPVLSEMMEQADAALLIGDDAIRAAREETEYTFMDLGEEWKRWTDHWMTFAVWAVRKETVNEYPEAVHSIHEAFLKSKREASTEPNQVALEASRRIGGEASYWRSYFANLCYDFGQAQQDGLQLYFDNAKQLGFLNPGTRINQWTNTTKTVWVKE